MSHTNTTASSKALGGRACTRVRKISRPTRDGIRPIESAVRRKRCNNAMVRVRSKEGSLMSGVLLEHLDGADAGAMAARIQSGSKPKIARRLCKPPPRRLRDTRARCRIAGSSQVPRAPSNLPNFLRRCLPSHGLQSKEPCNPGASRCTTRGNCRDAGLRSGFRQTCGLISLLSGRA